MSSAVSPVPKGFRTLTPHIVVSDAKAAADYYHRAFGAEVMGFSFGPDGKVMHAQVRIGDSILMFADHFPEFGAPAYVEGNYPFHFQIYGPDVDALWEKAVAAGCTVTMPLADMFWGDRYGFVRDPFGFSWALATRKEELTPEEMAERQKQVFAGGQA